VARSIIAALAGGVKVAARGRLNIQNNGVTPFSPGISAVDWRAAIPPLHWEDCSIK
jgi:hypothetical protein